MKYANLFMIVMLYCIAACNKDDSYIEGATGNNGVGYSTGNINGCSYKIYSGSGGCPSGYVYVGSAGCCPATYPYYCSSSGKCYPACNVAATSCQGNEVVLGR